MGNVGNSLLHFQIPLTEALLLLPQDAELAVHLLRKPAHMLIPGGQRNQRIGIHSKSFLKPASDFVRRPVQKKNLPRKETDYCHKYQTKQRQASHSELPSMPQHPYNMLSALL